MAAATATAPKKPAKAKDEGVKETLKRAGISTDLAGYTREQLDRAKAADPKLGGDRLRKLIMDGDGATSTRKKKYTVEVHDAAKMVRDVLGPRAGAPGPKQVAKVVKALGDRKPAQAVKLTQAELAGYASGKVDRTKINTAPLRELAKEIGDPWATGRRLAAILHSLIVVRSKAS